MPRLIAIAVLAVTAVMFAPPAFALSGMPGSFAELAKEAEPVVVNISTTHAAKLAAPQTPSEELYRRYYGGGALPQESETKSLGSGVIISADGYILTNNHVVADARDVKVKLPSGVIREAKVIGTDEKTDLALIKVDAEGLKAAKLADSDSLQVGDWVVAIGNPFGLSRTVTAGIVSAKGRELGAGPYDDFIQTDASINPGNSGGPLFNTSGEVVGINTAINAAAQGIGFAIPINIAKIVVRDLKEHGQVVRGWLGASAQVVTPELAEAFHMKEAKGLVVTGVEKGSPADLAGLRTGDVITEFGGKKLEHASALPWMVASSRVGTELPMKIIRDGADQTLIVKIAQMPGSGGSGAAQRMEESIGFTVTDLTPDIARQLGIEGRTGVLVAEVTKDSQAAEAGMRPGDLIMEVNGRMVPNRDAFQDAFKKLKPGDTVALYVQKHGESIFIPLKIK